MKFIIIIILTLSILKDVFAESLFTTKEYNIQFQSNNINIEKQKNINNIKLKSFNSIIKNILTEKNYKKLSRKIDLNFINKFILNMTINEEKIVNNNYYAKIKINFNKKLIINYLIKNKIQYVDDIPDKFLLIIYEENKIGNNFLSNKNNYYRYLLYSNNQLFNNFFLIPNLDFNDRFILNEISNENDYINKINKLNNKYKTNYQVLMHSRFIDDKYNIKIILIDKNEQFLLEEINIKNLNYEKLFYEIHLKTLNQWKKLNEINTSLINSLECKININNIYELKHVRNLLKSNHIIKSIDLKSIELHENIYNILYFGNINLFQKSLNKSRLILFFNNNICNIKLI